MFSCGLLKYTAQRCTMFYGGLRVTDIPYKKIIYIYIRITSVCLVYVGLAQARSNKNSDFLVVTIWMGLTHACPNDIT